VVGVKGDQHRVAFSHQVRLGGQRVRPKRGIFRGVGSKLGRTVLTWMIPSEPASATSAAQD
jgi:hypothetical protein